MITFKKETRNYPYQKDDRTFMYPVKYTIQFKDGLLNGVFTEHDNGTSNSIEKDSECWNYFQNKYK